MRKRVAREWLWVMILVIVATFTFLTMGCATQERVDQARQIRRLTNTETYRYSMIYLGYPSVYLLKFEGHDYLTRGGDSYMLHTVSCRGVHSE